MRTPPGLPTDRYELLDLLGDGGQGSTWRARDHAGGRDVAIKIFELVRHDDWKPYDLFERECRVLHGLQVDGIPDYIEYFADEAAGRYFLVMELMEGRCLRDELATGQRSDEARLSALLARALVLLEHLHDRQPPIIHRDIKPANLVERQDGRLALVDFGGVRVALRQDGGSTVVGTFGYMAPEQLHGEATGATDIYGLGATLLALAGGTDADKLPRSGLKIDVVSVLGSSPLASVLAGMVEPDPTHRLATVAAVRQALAEATPAAAADPAPAPEADSAEADGALAEQLPFTTNGVLSLFVWLATSVGSILLFFVGDVLLPAAFGVAKRRRRVGSNRRQRLESQEEKVRGVVKEQYRELRRLASAHDPEHIQSRWHTENQRKKLEGPRQRSLKRGAGRRHRSRRR